MNVMRSLYRFRIWFLALLLFESAALSMYLAHTSMRAKSDTLLGLRAESLQVSYEAVLNGWDNVSASISRTLADQPQVIDAISRANLGDRTTRQEMQEGLQSLLQDTFEILDEQGIDGLDIHLRDGTTLVHLSRYSDTDDQVSALSGPDYTSSQVPVQRDFELVPSSSSFRYLYPVRAQGELIGTIAMTMPFVQVATELATVAPGHYDIVLYHAPAEQPISSSERADHTASPWGADWIYDATRAPGHSAEDQAWEDDVIAQLAHQVAKEAEHGMAEGESFGLATTIKDRHIAVGFLPIRDAYDNQSAYLISCTDESELARHERSFWTATLGISLLSLITMAFALHGTQSSRVMRTNRDALQSITDHLGNALFLVNDKRQISFANPEAQRLMGATNLDLVGVAIDSLATLQDSSGRTLVGKEAAPCPIQTRKSENGEGILTCQAGHHTPVIWARTPIDQPDGSAVCMLVLRDMTERERAENALRTSEERQRELIKNMTSGMAVYETRDKGASFIIKDMNPAGLAMFNTHLAEIVDCPLLEAFPGAAQMGIEDALHQVWETGKPMHLPRKQYCDGNSCRWVENQIYRVPSGEVVAIFNDITQTQLSADALSESEKRYRTLVDRVPVGLYRTSPDGNILDANQAMIAMLKYPSREALLRVPAPDLYIDASQREGGIKHMAIEGVAPNLEFQLKCADGQTIWVRDSVRLVPDDEGKPLYYEGSLTDITDRKRAEEESRRLAAVVHQARSTVVITDLDANIVYANPFFEISTGYTCAEAIGKNPRILKSDLTGEQHYEELWGNLTQGQPWRGQFVNKRKDGSLYYEDATVFPIRNEQDRIINYAAVKQDITDQVHAEQALHNNLNLIETMLDTIPSPVFWKDNQGRYQGCNRSFAQDLMGLPKKDILGRTNFELSEAIPIDLAETYYQADQELISTGGSQVVEAEVSVAGERREHQCFKAIYNDASGATAGLVGVMLDISKHKRIQEELCTARDAAEAGARAKSEFLATMSHEIRTPMNGVIGMTGLMLETALTKEQREYVETIRVSGETLLTLINDILDFSKIESGHMEIESRPFCIKDCIEESLDLLSRVAKDKELDLLYLIEPDVPAWITGDVTRLRQVLVNLVSNATKFTQKGHVFVTVQQAPELNGAGSAPRLQFSVEDTGIGIPTDRLSRLFQPFSQADASTTRRFGGTGLGLAISRRLVALMGGDIWVDTEAGQGSTFHFTITAPVTEAPDGLAIEQPMPELYHARVLVVDDNPINCRILEQQCALWGMSAHAVLDAHAALDLLDSGAAFDLGIVDLQMPEMDGLELGRRLRAHPRASRMRLLMLSSIDRPATEADEFEALFDAFLNKPVRQAQLLLAVRRLLGAREQADTRQNSHRTTLDDQLATRLPMRILLAEDNPINQKLGLRILEKLGYRADLAGNGLEVLESLARQSYDVIFMDVQMPEMDGLQATREIIRNYTDTARPAIVAMTANARPEDRQDCLDAGMTEYLAKPIRPEQMQQMLIKIGNQLGACGSQTREAAPSKLAPDDELVDLRALESLGEVVGQEMLIELVDTFSQDARKDVTSMQEALRLGDGDRLMRAAHSLKGAALSMGAIGLSERCRQVERRAHGADFEGAASELRDIDPLFEQTCQIIRQIK